MSDRPGTYVEFCIVRLKNDLNIFERRLPISTVDDPFLIEDNTGAVYFQYDWRAVFDKSDRAADKEKYPETHSRKYFFLPQNDMKEGKEAEVSELYTNLTSRMKLEKKVTVVQVEPADYKAAFENDPNLVWFGGRSYRIHSNLDPVICMFSQKYQMDQFYAALAKSNRDLFMNDESDYLFILVYKIERAAIRRSKGDSFRDQHIKALSTALLHLLKTSSYIPGKAPKNTAKFLVERLFDFNFFYYDKNYCNSPGALEELRANLFHLHLTRLVYKNYFDTRRWKPACWSPSHFGWVICEVIEAKLSEKDSYFNINWSLQRLLMKDIFQQPCFRRFLKDEQLRKNFGNFILHYYPSIIEDEYKKGYNFAKENMKNMPIMETLFRGNYEEIEWEDYLDGSMLRMYAEKLRDYSYEVSVTDTINFTTAVLAMYPEEKKGERRKKTAENFLKYMDTFFVLGRLRERCIISEEKETDNFKQMQEILATCFRLPDTRRDISYYEPDTTLTSDVSSVLPLDTIYELYCQSKKEGKEVNPSAGLLWLGIAHRQAIKSLGELSEEQQTNCLEMLASALDDLPLQSIETFFNSIQGFTTRKTTSVRFKSSLLGKGRKRKIATDISEDKIPQDVDNITAEQGKALEQKRAEIEERISAYIAQRKKEETAVLFLFHSEVHIEVVKVNENMARYDKRHTTSAGIFIFMTLFEYSDVILKCTIGSSKKTLNYYVLVFTKYLINNTKVKNIFNKKSQLRYAVRKHIKGCLEHYNTYEQLNDLLTLDWQTYYNKWVAEKPVIGLYSMNTIKDLGVVGRGIAGSAHLCIVPNFVDSVVYKAFEGGIEGDVTAELNALMKLQAHAHIVRIFGVVMQSQTPRGLLMEYCEGGSLESVIGKKGYTFEERAAFHWMAQAASGLKFLHDNNIIHLDVKPANMLLSTNHRSLKLSDMGLTKVGKEGTMFNLTSEKGTVGYKAWEIVGGEDYSYPADIFSLGRCLWNLFYKKHPFDNIVALSVTIPAQSCKIFEGTDVEYAEDLEKAIKITKSRCVNGDLRVCRVSGKCDEKPYIKCPEHISKLILRMTAVDSTLRPTADQMYKELKEMCNAITEKETKATLQIIPSTKIMFLHPIEVNQSVGVKLGNTSKTETLQWSASSSNEKIAVVPAEGEIPPSEAGKVTLTYGEKSVVEENMGNFVVNYRIKMDTDKPEKEWASKHLKIVCNL